MDFKKYIDNVRSQLIDNASNEYKKQHVTYDYSNDLVDSNMDYFKDCYVNGLSGYKALLFFSDFLNEKEEF